MASVVLVFVLGQQQRGFSVGCALFLCWGGTYFVRVRLVLVPGQPCVDSSGPPCRSKWQPSESFCLAAVSDAVTKKKYKQRPLAVVEAREELHTQRRADGDERADEVDREGEGRAVVRDVLGQAVPVVLAAPADGQAADRAARAQ